MTDTKTASVLELLASRICHDLISPVGAINNGVEFVRDMGEDAGDDAIDLIAYSATQAAAKLQAFRLAYGAGGRDSNIKPEDIQRAFSNLISGEGKITQSWDPFGPLGPSPLPPVFCKVLMGAMMLAMESLPKGGCVSVKPGEGRQTLIIAEGDEPILRENVEKALKTDMNADELDPRLVHPFAIGTICTHYGYHLHVQTQEERQIIFCLDCPPALDEN